VGAPSIAELQRLERDMPKGQWALSSDEGARASVRLIDAAPVLLEIAAAAQFLRAAYVAGSAERERDALAALFRALNKVTP